MKTTLVDLRTAAAELRISRKKLLRLIRDGLPVTRKSERVYLDLGEAREWIAENDRGCAGTAPVLHPDDPRYREKLFSTRLDWLRAAKEAGVLVPLKELEERVADELSKLRTALLHAYGHFTPNELTLENVADLISPVLDDCLEYFRWHDPASWPTPQPAPPEPPKMSDRVPQDVSFAARYSEHDPRHAYHVGRAALVEAKYMALAENLLPLTTVFELGSEIRASIVDGLAQIPGRVELFAEPEDDLIDVFQREVREVLHAILN